MTDKEDIKIQCAISVFTALVARYVEPMPNFGRSVGSAYNKQLIEQHNTTVAFTKEMLASSAFKWADIFIEVMEKEKRYASK